MALPLADRVQRAVERFWAAHGPELAERPLVVGVSGGPDSVTLLHALAQLAPPRLVVVYVDHGQRPSEVAAEIEFVEKLSARLGAQFLRLSAMNELSPSGRGASREAVWREGRYRALAEAARLVGAGAVAVGHTADDQAETVLFNLLRGSGWAGLAAMAPVNSWPVAVEGAPVLWRPLLGVTRREIEAYLAAHTLPARQDSSNRSPAFARNRVRHTLLPLLEQAHPGARAALLRLARIAARDAAYWDAEVARVWAAMALTPRPPLPTRGEGEKDETTRKQKEGAPDPSREPLPRPSPSGRGGQGPPRPLRGGGRGVGSFPVLSLARWQALPEALRYRVLRRWLGEAVGPDQIVARHLEQAVDRLGARPTGRLSLPDGRRLVWGYGRAWLEAGAELAALAGVWPLNLPGETRLPGWRVEASLVEPDLAAARQAGPEEAWLDADALAGALRVRGWRPGDRMRPLGMAGQRKLQDLLVDAKVPRATRAAVPVVEDSQRIVWLVGVRLAEEARLRPESRRAWRLRFER